VIVVVGAGVVGLTCAVRLAEAGHAVRVVAREGPLDTTSAVAGAVWFPYLVAPRERVEGWAARTYQVLADLAAREPQSGVVMRELLVLGRAALPDPEWRDAVRGSRRAGSGELPAGYADGWVAEVPVVETPRHLPWLAARLARAGGALEVRPAGVASLAEAGAAPAGEAVGSSARLVVHCSGLGARALAADATMQPVRGQVVLLENPGLSRVVIDEHDPDGPTYVVPRRDDCVVGGTAEPGAEELRPDPATTSAILARAARLVPALAGARLLGAKVGLRPARPAVRLELERVPAGPAIVHCYGHGGAGFTLAWGCADEVVTLVHRTLAP
jgi:D-amino-acid oxidase